MTNRWRGKVRTMDEPDFPPAPAPAMPTVARLTHVHRWLPAGLTNAGTVLVQSCECGVVRTVKVPG